MMRRREFIAGLGGAAAWPVAVRPMAARAQQRPLPVIGFLHNTSPEGYAPVVAAFRQGLKEAGYVDGDNVLIDFRATGGDYNQLSAMAADLVRRQVAVIVAIGSPSAIAAKAATSTIPIVVDIGSDPVQLGLVDSLNQPGGNVTGLTMLSVELEAKKLEVLRELLPRASAIGMLFNPTNIVTGPETKIAQDAARSLGLQLHVLNATTESEIETAFRALAELRASALAVSGDGLLNSRRAQIVALAARHAVPAVYAVREFVTAGGLMSYGTDLADTYRQAGIYAGKILKGAKPVDLPVQRVTKVEFVINLKTAKTLGLTFPITLLALADEVIE